MPMRPFTENYDEYLQSSEDEFKDLQDRSFEEQQLIRSAAERDPRQYRGIGYGGLTGKEKEAVEAAGMKLPQNLIARENVQQKYRRAAAAKGFGFDEKVAPSIAEKTVEARKAGLRGMDIPGGEGDVEHQIPELEGSITMAQVKQMLTKFGPYAAQLGLGAVTGMPAPMLLKLFAKTFATKYGIKALKGLYGQAIGKVYGEGAAGMETPDIGGAAQTAGQVAAATAQAEGSQAALDAAGAGQEAKTEAAGMGGFGTGGSISPAFGGGGAVGYAGRFGGGGGGGDEDRGGFGGGGMGGGRGGETERESDPSGGMGGY